MQKIDRSEEMTPEEAIKQLEFDREMILFDPSTGETLAPEIIKLRNKENYLTYIADGVAIEALKEVQQYREIGTIAECKKAVKNKEDDMKNYSHNGNVVSYDMIRDFLGDLNRQGINPEELPILDDYRVFKYTLDGASQYAAVVTREVPEDGHWDEVYITDSYPEDGFSDMINDVNGQRNGEEPRQMRSRLKAVLEIVEDKAAEQIREKYNVDLFAWMMKSYPEDVKKAYINRCKDIMYTYGYNLETLEKINASEKDKEYAREILTR